MDLQLKSMDLESGCNNEKYDLIIREAQTAIVTAQSALNPH
jgi:hypothetical protein